MRTGFYPSLTAILSKAVIIGSLHGFFWQRKKDYKPKIGFLAFLVGSSMSLAVVIPLVYFFDPDHALKYTLCLFGAFFTGATDIYIILKMGSGDPKYSISLDQYIFAGMLIVYISGWGV